MSDTVKTLIPLTDCFGLCVEESDVVVPSWSAPAVR